MKPSVRRQLFHQEANYEQVTRQVRWLTIGIALVTFPWGQPQSLLVYSLVALAVLYNLCRYMPTFARVRWLSSRVTMLTLDNLFVAMLLFCVGQLGTPYTGFLVL